jgi:hypothetical protein
LIIVDEAAFISEDLFLQVIVPVLKQSGTVFIGLTTPENMNAPIMQIYNTRDENGDFIIPSIRIGQICAECQRLSRICTHEDNALAAGSSHSKTAKYQRLYTNQALFMQEMFGQASRSGMDYFQAAWLANLLEKPPVDLRVSPGVSMLDMIMITIDPAMGGSCEWGLCACIYNVFDQTQNIIQLEKVKIDFVSEANVKAWLSKILTSIRLRYEYLPIVIACESGPLGSAIQVSSCIFQLIQEGRAHRCYMMYGNTGKPAIVKTPEITDEMASTTRQLLENNKVNFTKDFCTCSEGHTSESMKQQYASQLLNFISNEEKKQQDGSVKTKLHGKAAGNDDLAVAIIMSYRNYVVFKTSADPRYNAAKLLMPKQIVNLYVRLHAPTNEDLLKTSAMTERGTTISHHETQSHLQRYLAYEEQKKYKRNNF